MTNVLEKLKLGKLASGMVKLSIDGRLAIKTDNGYMCYNETDKSFINCDDLTIDLGEDLFIALPTNSVKEKDIILVNGQPVFVLSVNKDTIKVMSYIDGAVKEVMPEKHIILGKSYLYTKIVSLLNFGKDNNDMMKYLMFSQLSGNKQNQNITSNPLALMMLCGNNNLKDNDMMKYLLLSNMTGTDNNQLALMMMLGGENNLFSGLFGTEKVDESKSTK